MHMDMWGHNLLLLPIDFETQAWVQGIVFARHTLQ